MDITQITQFDRATTKLRPAESVSHARLVELDAEAGLAEKGYSHTRDVHGFSHVGPEPCMVEVTGWPYPCISRDKHPDHVVFTCRTHYTWWHRSPAELGLA